MGLFRKKEKEPSIKFTLSSLIALRRSMDNNIEFAKTTLDATIGLLKATSDSS